MLSDAERQRLTEIEFEPQLEDPRLAERFGRGGQHDPRMWCGMTARVWLVVTASTMGLAVLMANAHLSLPSAGKVRACTSTGVRSCRAPKRRARLTYSGPTCVRRR